MVRSPAVCPLYGYSGEPASRRMTAWHGDVLFIACIPSNETTIPTYERRQA